MTRLITTFPLFALTLLLNAAVVTASAQMTPPATPPAASDTPANKPEKTAKAAAKSGLKILTFKSKLASSDKVARTITLDENKKHMLQITSDTIITRDGKPAIFADGAVGDPTRGTYKISDDGKLLALTVNFGETPKAPKPAKKPKQDAAAATNAPAAPATAPMVAPAPAAAPVVVPLPVLTPGTNAPAQ